MEELLDALEGVPEGAREAYLERACPDPALRQEVLAHVAVEPTSTGYLDRFMGLVEALTPKRTEIPELTGKRIGPYRLRRLLGRGGMGVVYEAERADGSFEQSVALKLLPTALAGTEAHERFLAERRILAGLKHSAIAHIMDGGVTEDGTPWFAMEHVEGEPIDAYCDRRRLGIRERLELFLQICDAVEHAHRRLVVHRDLKPSNVLVAEESVPSPTGAGAGATPQVKLLDFGIARLLEREETTSTTPPTRTALHLMTPEYASPEQVRGEAVTTASDVYQLGLVLYELLTGHRPYVLRRRSASEIEHVICNQIPTRLSAAILREDTLKAAGADPAPDTRPAEAGSAAAATRHRGRTRGAAVETTVQAVCRARSSSPVRLRRRLRGDLENIVAKALSKEPERRYGSADRLAQDLRRHLAGLPVTARADTWVYRSRKFLERHAIGAAAAAMLLVFATGTTSIYMTRIQSERDRAEAEATKADQVVRFLIGLFRGADPLEARGTDLSARELLDRGVAQVDQELASQPDVQATMLRVLGRTYLELGLYESADSHLGRALELSRDRRDPSDSDLPRILTDLGLLRYRQGRYRLAQKSLERAEEILADEGAPVDRSPEVAELLQILGHTYRMLGEYEKSLAALERAVTIQSGASGEHSVALASSLHSLALLLGEVGEFDRADELYERTLTIYEEELAENDPRIGHVLMSLAANRSVQGRSEGVEALFRRSVAILEAAYGPEHVRVAQALSGLGDFVSHSGRYGEAIEILERAVALQTAATGLEHAELAYPLASLGAAQRAAGRLQEARRSYRRTVAVRQSALETREFDPLLVHGLVEIGRIEAELGNDIASEQKIESALRHWRRAPEAIDPQLAPALRFLGHWLTERERCTEASPILQRALHMERSRRSPSTSAVAEIERLLGGCA